jgi:hypothetical protein
MLDVGNGVDVFLSVNPVPGSNLGTLERAVPGFRYGKRTTEHEEPPAETTSEARRFSRCRHAIFSVDSGATIEVHCHALGEPGAASNR